MGFTLTLIQYGTFSTKKGVTLFFPSVFEIRFGISLLSRYSTTDPNSGCSNV